MISVAMGPQTPLQPRVPPVKGTQPAQGRAALAQSVEHIIRNDGVRCSSHLSGTIFNKLGGKSGELRLAFFLSGIR